MWSSTHSTPSLHLVVGEAVPVERRHVQELDARLRRARAASSRAFEAAVDDGRHAALLQTLDLPRRNAPPTARCGVTSE